MVVGAVFAAATFLSDAYRLSCTQSENNNMHRFPPAKIDVDRSLVERLMQQGDGEEFELIETHISWLLLQSDWAFKVKKPVFLGFLDFRELEQRRFYCEEEIRLNQPFCPEIYVDVVPITEADGRVRIGGEGSPLEYAVRMRRFDQALRLDAQLEAGELVTADMRELAEVVAQRHQVAAVLHTDERARAIERVGQFALENFPPLAGAVDEAIVSELLGWTKDELDLLQPLLRQRFDDGWYRECHGDLHLANLVRLPSGIAAFDSLEFSAELRNTDVMADVAFLVMDLAVRDQLSLAAHFLNRYLEVSGDYDGMRVFNLYFTYRCLVRAKVAVIRGEERRQDEDRQNDLDEARRYCELALRQTRRRRRVLVAMHGLSGAGKTWVSGKIMDRLPGIRIRSDVERKRIFELAEMADSKSGIGKGIYSDEATADVYEHLNSLAGRLLAAGHNVILDASFLHKSERAVTRRVAEQSASAFIQLQVIAPEARLRERVKKRREGGADVSEAGTEVLDHQLANYEAPASDELRYVLTVHSEEFDAAELCDDIRQRAAD